MLTVAVHICHLANVLEVCKFARKKPVFDNLYAPYVEHDSRFEITANLICRQTGLTVISADADGPRDAASRPSDNIVLHTDLDAECDHPAGNKHRSIFENILLHRPTAVGC